MTQTNAQRLETKTMPITTLVALRKHEACIDGCNKLACNLIGQEFDPGAEDWIETDHVEPITMQQILDSNGLDDALWALRAFDQTPELQRAERLFAVWCARQVQHLMDSHSIAALDVAERYANGHASDGDLAAAWDAARGAARAAAWDAARAAQKTMFIAVFCGDSLNVAAMYAAQAERAEGVV